MKGTGTAEEWGFTVVREPLYHDAPGPSAPA